MPPTFKRSWSSLKRRKNKEMPKLEKLLARTMIPRMMTIA